MESPGKPPSPTIVISSDEEIVAEFSSGSEYTDDNAIVTGKPGPAYRKPATRQASSPMNSEVSSGVEVKIAQHQGNVTQGTKNSSSDKAKSPTQSSIKSNGISIPKDTSSLVPEELVSEVRVWKSTPIPPPKARTPASQRGSSTQTQEPSDKVNSLTTVKGEQADPALLETDKQSETTEDDSEEESDSTETHDTPKKGNTPAAAEKEDVDQARLNADAQNETTDEDSEEESEDAEFNNIPTPAIGLALASGGKGHSGQQGENINDETTDHELEEDSDEIQAEIDDQLLTQSFESKSSLQKLPKFPDKGKALPRANTDAEAVQKYSSARPSLRRMNQEAQRTKLANSEAAKARGLEKVQKMGNGVKRTGLLAEDSEDSLSDTSSTSSSYGSNLRMEDSSDEDKSKSTRADHADLDQGDLDNEDAEEMGEQLIAKITDLGAPSSNWDKKDGMKPGKIGWTKRGKQFGANKNK
jgi:hypothetical protein